jgi:glycosyltransferase involved in cell wall biosynthesis
VSDVLFLAYHFPPTGGAGVQRSAKFARYLPELGYRPLVLTGPGAVGGRWTPEDRSLLADIPESVEVHRITAQPPESGRARARAERWLRLRTPFARWWVEGAVAQGAALGARADLIYASMSPFQSAEAAARLSRRLRLPWVADLRDPWALDEMIVYPSALHRRLERRRMRTLLASAAAIVMNTAEAAAALTETFPELRGKLVEVIPNGYDAADFEGPDPPRDDGRFTIVHAGYLHTELGRSLGRARRLLGGSLTGVDIGTRSHLYLIEAIERVIGARPELTPFVTVDLAGVLSDQDRAAISSPVVRTLGYLSHPETIRLVRGADLLFLPMHDLPPGSRARIVPGKTYEYLASGRPVLAAVPAGDARDLLVRCDNALVCAPADVAAMARAIEGEAVRFLERGHAPTRRPDAVLPFERRALSARLAALFDRVLGRPRRSHQVDVSVPGSGSGRRHSG